MPARGDAGELGLRLFLEGVEVPVIGAVVNIGPGAPAQCNLQIVPTDRALEFLPRTTVHLFFYDFTADDVGEFDHEEEETETTFFRRYKLLFMGEMVSMQESKNSGGRQVVLQCLDFSMYWDTAYQYMLTYGPNGSGILGSPAKFMGANDYLFDDIINDPVSVTSGLVSSGQPRTPGLKGVPGLMGGLIRVLEAMGGVWYTEDSSVKVRGINDFFTFAELRLKLLQQIGAESGDNTAQNIFEGKVFSQWLSNSLGGGGGLMSFRDILRLISSYIYYEIVPNPSAMLIPSTEIDATTTHTQLVGRRSDGRDLALYNNVYDLKADLHRSRVGAATQRVTADAALVADLEGGFGPTDSEEVVLSSADMQPFWLQTDWMAREAATLAVDAGSVAGYFIAAQGKLEEITVTLGNMHQGIEAITENALGGLNSKFEEVLASLDSAWNASSTTVVPDTESTYSRVPTQIFRPDIWMCAPPRCNVIFPEQYSSFVYQRNYLREVTRLQLATSMEIIGPDPILDDYYEAPNPTTIRGHEATNTERQKYLLWDHEIYSGIVPKFTRLSEAGFFANQAQRQLLNVTARTSKAVFATRAAHFNFFKYRFAPRSLQLTGKFNPYLVCGLPALVIRKGLELPSEFATSDILAFINAGAKELELGFGTDATGQTIVLPTQYVGMLNSLSHQVNQQGGNTTMGMGYARAHRTKNGEDDEYIQLKREEPAQRTFVSVYGAEAAVNSYRTEALEWLKKITPQVGYEEPDAHIAAFIGQNGPLGGTIAAITHSDTVFNLVEDSTTGEGTESVLWSSATIKETMESSQYPAGITVDKPFEEQIRPSWFSPIYSNANIGDDFYQKLFGVGSIVDDTETSSGDLTDAIVVEYGEPADSTMDPNSVQGATVVQEGSLEELRVALSANVVLAEQEVSIAKAADFLGALYGSLRKDGNDILKFVSGYTRRPVATMEEIMGSPDLEFDSASGDKLAGTEGFHSRAFGNYEGGTLLTEMSAESTYQRIDGSAAKAIDLTADPRKKRWERVHSYMSELRFSRGLQG